MIKKIVCVLLILCFALGAASCGSEEMPEGTEKVTNDKVDFTVYYPEGWVVETNEPKSAVISLVYGETSTGSNKSSIRVTELSIGKQFSSPKEYWESYLEDFKSQFGVISILDEKEVTLDDVKAFRVYFTADVANETFNFVQVLAIRTEYIYTITYTAKKDDFDTSALDTVVKYFKFK